MAKSKDRRNFGRWTLPTKWDEVTLGQFSELEKLYDGKASDGVNQIDVISVLSGKPRDEVMALPVEFVEKMVGCVSFLDTEPEVTEADFIEVDGEVYRINKKEDLRFGEYSDADSVLKNTPWDYPSLLAILCRKEGEKYDADYIAGEFENRKRMFASIPVVKVLGMTAFFLKRWRIVAANSLLCSRVKDKANRTLDSIESSLKSGRGLGLRSCLLRRKLKKLRRSINSD